MISLCGDLIPGINLDNAAVLAWWAILPQDFQQFPYQKAPITVARILQRLELAQSPEPLPTQSCIVFWLFCIM